MSVLSFTQRDDDEATVWVDTRASHGGETSKMFPLGHLGAIVAGRGRSVLVLAIVSGLMTCSTFDEALDKIEGIYGDALAELKVLDSSVFAESQPLLARMSSIYGSARSEELLLVGWSDRENSVHAVSIVARADGEMAVLRRAALTVAPEHPAVIAALEKGVPSDDEALDLARMQIEHARMLSPSAADAGLPGFGGRLLVGKVTRGEVSVRNVGVL